MPNPPIQAFRIGPTRKLAKNGHDLLPITRYIESAFFSQYSTGSGRKQEVHLHAGNQQSLQQTHAVDGPRGSGQCQGNCRFRHNTPTPMETTVSVYTVVTIQDLEPFTIDRNLGQPRQLEAIAQGIINSNYRLTTSRGTVILTLVENPEEAQALPHIMALLEQLGQAGLPVPRPIKDANDQAVFTLHGRPAVMVTQLPGVSPNIPSAAQCHQLGSWLGTLHIRGMTVPMQRPDRLSPEAWATMLDRLYASHNAAHEKTIAWLQREWAWLNSHWFPLDLPQGVCHGDLFPDNTLFSGDQLTGIIDFYSACHAPWLYDLAISLCAWCLDDAGQPHPERIHALMSGYNQVRPLTLAERNHLQAACRTAAFRFSLSRFHDHCFPREGATVTRRNPESFMARLRFLQSKPLPGVPIHQLQ